MPTAPILSNPLARRLFLHAHALAEPTSGPCNGQALCDLIDRIGFVQVDSINTVARAHDMILWSRRMSYRPDALRPLLDRHRLLWEHWTHDAAILPAAIFPHWHHRFARDRTRLVERWTGWQRDGFHTKFDEVLRRVTDHGPVTSADVGEGETRGKGGWWDWHPSKAALEYLWRVGELSVTRREGFRKVYDLTERVLPLALRNAAPSLRDSTEWACNTALDHLGFATPGEIAAFWGAVSPDQAKGWCATGLATGSLIQIAVEGADGTPRPAFARPGVLTRAAKVPPPTNRLRILSPFDPALRDRKRAERLFGFRYRIEVFVPAPQRRYGYYVFPVLEGDRLIGRVDAKANRDASTLAVRAFWPERGVRMGAGRVRQLMAEIHRLARLAACERVTTAADWLRETLPP